MKTKKILVFLVMISLMLPVVMAYSSTTTRGIKGIGSAVISTNQSFSLTHSAKLSAPFDNSTGPEGRVRIKFTEDVTLNDINSISWMQYVTAGYAAHVDILIDTTGDGLADDALVFEYDKVKTGDGTGVKDYNFNQWIDTLESNADEITGDSYAWLGSGAAGNSDGDPNYFVYTLSAWKSLATTTNGKTINKDTIVTALEFEVDGWIIESEAYIDDIKINGIVVEDFDGNQGVEVVVEEVIAIFVNNINYGSVAPNSYSDRNSKITVEPNNNVDLSVSISVSDAGTNNLFHHIIFDLDSNGFDEIEIGTSTLDLDIDNDSNPNPVIISTRLRVPEGFAPGTNLGTINYIAMKRIV